jgi:hypothetical protein
MQRGRKSAAAMSLVCLDTRRRPLECPPGLEPQEAAILREVVTAVTRATLARMPQHLRHGLRPRNCKSLPDPALLSRLARHRAYLERRQRLGFPDARQVEDAGRDRGTRPPGPCRGQAAADCSSARDQRGADQSGLRGFSSEGTARSEDLRCWPERKTRTSAAPIRHLRKSRRPRG